MAGFSWITCKNILAILGGFLSSGSMIGQSDVFQNRMSLNHTQQQVPISCSHEAQANDYFINVMLRLLSLRQLWQLYIGNTNTNTVAQSKRDGSTIRIVLVKNSSSGGTSSIVVSIKATKKTAHSWSTVFHNTSGDGGVSTIELARLLLSR